jgi:pseudolysin
MHINYYLPPIAFAIAISSAFSVKAATSVALPKATLLQLQKQFYMPSHYFKNSAALLRDKLQLLHRHIDANKTIHTRMQQYYLGFPVRGGYAIIHEQQNPATPGVQPEVSMNGTVYQGLEKELGNPPASFTADATSVLNQLKQKYANEEIGEEEAIPMVYIDPQRKAHWAYKVSFTVHHQDQVPERPVVILDAISHQIFEQWNDIHTARVPAKATGFGGNNKTHFFRYGTERPLLEIMRDDVKQVCFMENEEVKVVNMMHHRLAYNEAMEFSCRSEFASHSRNVTSFSDKSAKKKGGSEPVFYTGMFIDGYDKENGAASPSNDALYAGNEVKKMYKDWYKTDVLVKNGTPMQLIMRVHYGQFYENAFWDGRQMSFGDGGEELYPLVSLSITAHEVSHGFTQQNSGLEYHGQSGGLNESFSDMAAQAAEAYAFGKNKWQFGYEVTKEGTGIDAFRYMDQPSRDGHSIDKATEYYPQLDVHFSSGVFNRMFYVLATQKGWTVRKAFAVMLKANKDYWIPTSTFEEAACGILHAAHDLHYSGSDVLRALMAVDVDSPNCYPVFPFDLS